MLATGSVPFVPPGIPIDGKTVSAQGLSHCTASGLPVLDQAIVILLQQASELSVLWAKQAPQPILPSAPSPKPPQAIASSHITHEKAV